MKKANSVLLTGISGFVGTALGHSLRSSGYCVTGISRSAPPPSAADQFLRHDLVNPLPATLPRHDVVIHAAALTKPWARPAAYEANNVAATRNIVNYALQTEVDYFVHISSTAVLYELRDQFDLSEETHYPAKAVNSYAESKREAERIIHTAGLRCASILRPRAVYGPGDSQLIPRIIRAARAGILPNFVRPDGLSPQVDMVFIGNLTNAVQQAISKRLDNVINITDGCPVTINTLLSEVLTRTGCTRRRFNLPVPVAMRVAAGAEWISAQYFGWREPPITRFGISALCHSKTFDVSRMLELIGTPPFTPAQGITATVDWLNTREDI